jgi:oligo-alginate lyase
MLKSPRRTDEAAPAVARRQSRGASVVEPTLRSPAGLRPLANAAIRRGFCLRLILALASCAAPLVAPAASSSASLVTPRPDHPRLFFTADRIARLKDRITREKSAADAWSAILASVDRTDGANAGRNLEALALAYRMTGDQRFAERIRDALQREIRRPTWGEAELLRRDPPWQAGLGLARSLYSAAIAYDAIHDFLSPDERRTFAKGIVDLGILPTLDDWVLGEKRIHSLDTMGHNWWSACVFVAGIGALAVLDEEPRAAGWLQRISAGSVEWFGYAGSLIENKPANFDRAGAFYESINYASFALSEYLLFRLAWTNALRAPAPAELPLLDRVGDFFLHASYPNQGRMMTLNFGDGSLTADGSRPVSLLWANGIRKPAYAWYLNATRQAAAREGLDRTSPFGLLYFPTAAELADAPASPPLPASNAFTGIGWATLRSSWGKNATLFGLRAGYTWNHAHADTGSFILFHRGENLLIDSGNSSYARPEYDAYYRQSQAHNVVLFNGAAENPEDTYFGSKFPGSVSHLIDTGDLKYVFADATGPTSKNFVRNYRHVLWLGDVILIIDDVESFQPGQFEWLLHFAGKAERHGQDLAIAQNDARILVRPLFPMPFPDAGLPTDYPENMKLVEKTGLKDHEPDSKVVYYAFTPTELTRRTKFITAITLVTDQNKDHLPQLERLSANNMIGVRVRQSGSVTDVYLNLLADGRIRHRNANNSFGGWQTDAYLTAITCADGANVSDADTVSRIFVADGSYLRRDQKVVLDSLSKVFLVASRSGDALEVELQGQPVINAAWRSTRKPTSVRLNGREAEPTYDAAAQSVMLSLTAVP